MNETTPDLIGWAAKGVSSLSTMMLDNLGIAINLKQVYEDYANNKFRRFKLINAIRKSLRCLWLSRRDKKLAVLVAILEKGERCLEK